MTTKRGIDVMQANPSEIQDAVKKGIPLLNVSRIATHPWPHLDEIAALVLLTMYGEKAFPGISKSFKLCSISNLDISRNYGENAWYKLLSEGVLSVGTGGGPLDDHYGDNGVALKEGSATSRVAYFLGIEELPELKHLLKYVDHEDNNGDNPNLTGASGDTAKAAQLFMLATTIKSTWRMMRQEKREEGFIDKVEQFMDMVKDRIKDQKHFIAETGPVLASAEKIPLTLMTASKVPDPTLVVVKSDSERAQSIVRSSMGRSVVAIIQIMSNGRLFISASTKNGGVPIKQLDDVVKGIRSQIIRWKNWKNGNRNIQNDWRETQKEGYHKGTEELYYFRKGSMVFNGSLTQPDVPGLIGNDRHRFPMNERELIDIVTIALEDQYWPKESRSECSKGECPAHRSEFKCPIFAFGLYRCYKNRQNS